MGNRTYWLETLGCPKNEVDSDKLRGTLEADGLAAAEEPGRADVVVINTCAFVEEARQESIDTVFALSDERGHDAELVVTGCLAERYGDELAKALPEADRVAGFGVPVSSASGAGAGSGPGPGVPVSVGSKPRTDAFWRTDPPAEGGSVRQKEREGGAGLPTFDLLNLPRPRSPRPWAYVKVAEGCDRACGFCAIPSFRGPQRSRTMGQILDEVESLEACEVVLVAQDLASWGRDQGVGERRIAELVAEVDAQVPWVRLLYLYPADLTDALIDAIGATEVPYYDLSLQHVSRPLLRRMRRWGDGDRFLDRIAAIRRRHPEAVFRSNFIVGYPGETEADHQALADFIEAARLDWSGFFTHSMEHGTYAAGLDGVVPAGLAAERCRELEARQSEITAEKRDELIGRRVRALVDAPGIARSHREAPEIDGVIEVPDDLAVGSFVDLEITGSLGVDLSARPAASPAEATEATEATGATGAFR